MFFHSGLKKKKMLKWELEAKPSCLNCSDCNTPRYLWPTVLPMKSSGHLQHLEVTGVTLHRCVFPSRFILSFAFVCFPPGILWNLKLKLRSEGKGVQEMLKMIFTDKAEGEKCSEGTVCHLPFKLEYITLQGTPPCKEPLLPFAALLQAWLLAT